MISFKEFYINVSPNQMQSKLLLEYECYKLIPKTNKYYREDPCNTSTKTERHAHIYARPKGDGKELYAVNINGKGHDGSKGIVIPSLHAEYFRSIGYNIPVTNILESIELDKLKPQEFQILFG